MSIHGYVSFGKWQDKLSNYLEELKVQSAPYKYGYKLFRILPRHIQKDAEDFRDWYFSVAENANYDLKISEPFHRPNIMAHSLGTWILVKALIKYPEIKFDKIFLFGSIIPADFDWFQLLLRDQVNSVIYERAKKDKIAPLGLVFTGTLKPCGTKGFTQKSSFIKEEMHPFFDHSDFNYKAHFQYYVKKWLSTTPHQLIVKEGRDLKENEIKKLFKETQKFDSYFYSEEYLQDEISNEKAISWFRVEKDIWSFVLNVYTGDPVGYINAIPVNDTIYNQYCLGELSENNIMPTDVLDYDTCVSYNLIVLSVAIRRVVKNEETTLMKGRIAEMLIMSFVYKVNRHNNGLNKLKKIAAFAWTNEGVKLCEGFCMRKVSNSYHSHPLYEIDLNKLTRESIKEANFMSRWWYQQMLNL